jgi:hypothetical protein
VRGPHAAELHRHIRDADLCSALKAEGLRYSSPTAITDIKAALAEYVATGTALPMAEDRDVARRLAAGWASDDPVLQVATGTLARRIGYFRVQPEWLSLLRGPLQDAAAKVGIEKPFGREAAEVATAGGSDSPAWTPALHRSGAVAIVGVVRTAAIIVLAMRASELMALRVGCRCPVEEPIPGLRRFRIASKLVKGQPLGGTDDEWIVVEPAYRAVELIEQLHDDPRGGELLLGRFAFRIRYMWFRAWVNSPAGSRIGLAPIPAGQVNLRKLRRTLSLEMAYRPGGVLATKIHLKHIAVAATEGYSSRPGGAQAELLTEVNRHEATETWNWS